MNEFILYNYFRSSTSTRVRVALNLKGLRYEYVARHLRKNQHRTPDYLAVNPQGLVPALRLNDGHILTQSLAIIEYLEETYPEPALLPRDPRARARVRALAYAVACDIHPINNLRVMTYLRNNFDADDAAIAAWFQHWVRETFGALEVMLSSSAETGRFCQGGAPGLADICLYAQVLNNARFGVDTAAYPTIDRIFRACAELPAFVRAAPSRQPDAE